MRSKFRHERLNSQELKRRRFWPTFWAKPVWLWAHDQRHAEAAVAWLLLNQITLGTRRVRLPKLLFVRVIDVSAVMSVMGAFGLERAFVRAGSLDRERSEKATKAELHPKPRREEHSREDGQKEQVSGKLEHDA